MAVRIAPLDDNLDFPEAVQQRQAERLADKATPEGTALREAIKESAGFQGAVSETPPANPTVGMLWFRLGGHKEPMDYIASFTASSLGLPHSAAVTTWPATNSAHAFTATGSPTYQTNGAFPCVQTNGTTDYLTASTLTANQPDTIVVVGRFTALAPSKFLYAGASSAGNQSAGIGATATNGAGVIWAGRLLTGPPSDTDWHVYIGTYNGSNSELRIDNTITHTGNAGGNPLSAGLRLAGSENGTNYTAAQYAEVRVYNRTLSSLEKDDLVAALRQKYGIN